MICEMHKGWISEAIKFEPSRNEVTTTRESLRFKPWLWCGTWIWMLLESSIVYFQVYVLNWMSASSENIWGTWFGILTWFGLSHFVWENSFDLPKALMQI